MDRNKITIHLESSLCLMLALMLLLLPLPWVMACVLASLAHEICHAVAIRFMGSQIYALRLGSGGIRMETDYMTPGRELVAALAGPIGSALLILLAPWLPRTAVCGAGHCLYNLLPLFPLDGGRILRNLLELVWPMPQAEAVFRKTQQILRLIFCVVCIGMTFYWGILPAAVVFALLLRGRGRELFDKLRFWQYNGVSSAKEVRL